MVENKNKKSRTHTVLITLSLISLILANFFIFPAIKVLADDTVDTLNQKISDKKNTIDALQKEISAYQQQISQKQQEAATLTNELAILANEIAKVDLDIQSTQAQIDETNLEIQNLNLGIKSTEQKIAGSKDKLAEFVRQIAQTDQVSYLEIILTKNSFSDFFDQVQYVEQLHHNIENTLTNLKTDKKDLETQKQEWLKKADLENTLKDQLVQQKTSLDEKNIAQQTLLAQNKMTTRQYRAYTYQLQLQQQQINSDIVTIEKQVRQKLAEQQRQNQLSNLGPAKFDWPINPSRGISAYFHDPSYPFRYIFEHPAIDIRTAQGTPIKAPADGYVATVKFKGDRSYAYIMLIHSDGFSTVYGHISAAYVKPDEYVNRGEVIGLTGATPGSVGAGPFTTGPHLHFEVRLNGIPVNPLEYLPPT